MLLELGGRASCPACGFWLRRLGVLVFAGYFVAALLVVTALNRFAVINLQRLDRREPARAAGRTSAPKFDAGGTSEYRNERKLFLRPPFPRAFWLKNLPQFDHRVT